MLAMYRELEGAAYLLMHAIRRLDDQARQLEAAATGPSLAVFIADERSRSALFDGRSVFGWENELTEKQSG